MINHKISGTGDNWLVFVHGLTCDHSDWALQLQAFEAEYRCLAVDLRGHGASTMSGPLDIEAHASDVVQLLCRLNIENAVLVGHSMGTRVVASAFIQASDRVAGLVFVDGSAQGSGDPIQAGEKITQALADDNLVPEFVQRMFSTMFIDSSDSALKQRVLQRAGRMPVARLREQMRLMMMWDAGRFKVVLSQIDVPLSVLQSTGVDANRKRHTLSAGDTTPYLEAIRELAPHANIEIVSDCGHFTQYDAAEATNRTISKMLQSVL